MQAGSGGAGAASGAHGQEMKLAAAHRARVQAERGAPHVEVGSKPIAP